MLHGGNDVDVEGCVREIATGLVARVPELTADIEGRLVDELPELGPATRTSDMFRAGIGGNIETVLQALQHGVDIQKAQAPFAAMEHARRLAQQGVPVHTLVRAYRIGQRRTTEVVFAAVAATDLTPVVRMRVLERITTTLFDYIDRISQQVVETYEVERERWLENQNSLRALRVHEILTARTPVDVDAATSAIRYPLRWHHLAMVVWRPWSSSDDTALSALQRYVRDLAEAAGADAGALFVPADHTTGWAWLPFRAHPADAIEQIRGFSAPREDAPSIAIGPPADGVDGFCASHRLATAAHAVALARNPTVRVVISASDPGVATAALLGGDLGQARHWVRHILGDLAHDTDGDARLRETLYAFLNSGGSRKATGEKLNLHPNTVKYRVDRAIARRGRDIGADRLDVELALLLCQWYATAVLSGAD